MTAPEYDDTSDLDDNAAEPDDTEPDDVEPEPVYDNEAGYAGTCSGGPYHGRTVVSRFPKGFLLVDRPTSRAWLYDWTPPGFVLRVSMPNPMPLLDDGRWKAAEGEDFDVIAYDDEQVPR